ncbi:MAG: MMPL family transporter, partial [Acidimicrobiales bacterium]
MDVQGRIGRAVPTCTSQLGPAAPLIFGLENYLPHLLYRLGRMCARHPWRTLGSWALVALFLTLAGQFGGGGYTNTSHIPHSQAQQAETVLNAAFGASGSNATVAIAARGPIQAPTQRAGLDSTLARLARLPKVAQVSTPSISPDGTSALINVTYKVVAKKLTKADFKRLDAAAGPARAAGDKVAFSGDIATLSAGSPAGSSEEIGIIVAVLVLIGAFGSLVAAGLPILTGALGLAAGLAGVKLMAHLLPISSDAPSLASMIGLGVGIDYALFVVTRYREEIEEGVGVSEAAGRCVATAGSSVVIAGLIVIFAICGLALSGIALIAGLGYATAVVVAVSVTAAITLLPAVLGLAGTRINRLRIPGLGRHRPGRHQPGRNPCWAWRWARIVGRRRWAFAGTSLALLVVLALPAFSMRLGQTDAGSNPTSTTTRQAYDITASHFGPGANGPLELAIQFSHSLIPGPGPGSASLVGTSLSPGAVPPAVNPILAAVAHDPDVAAVHFGQLSRDGRTATVEVIPRTSPQAKATSQLVVRLRQQVLPPVARASAATVLLTGQTAANVDVAHQISSRLALLLAAVLGLSVVIIGLIFRSVAVALSAAIMNLLSIGASLGVVVASFQWGWLKGLTGLGAGTPISSFVPMLTFAILFGLSMDYEVFLLSRIREAWKRTASSTEAIVEGVGSTGRVITSAALIMISVFLSFVTMGDPVVKQMGIALAAGVLIDATVIRMVLVPSTMAILGRSCWWMPRWLAALVPVHFEHGSWVPVPLGQAGTDAGS